MGKLDSPVVSESSQAQIDTLLARLNPPQQEAVTHGDGPLLIFAGAGSGKTRVLTARIAYLIASRRVWPDRLLAVTFTNKAAREMRSRVESLVGERAEKMWVGTFHSTAVKILRREAQRIGIVPSFVIFDDDDTRAALRRVLDELRLDPKRYPIGALSHGISQAKSELRRPEDIPNRSYQDEILRRVYESYQEVLRRSGGLDFDDLIMKLVELYSTDAEALAKWRDRFRHVLVDEYQDTNRAQYVLVNVLARRRIPYRLVGGIRFWERREVKDLVAYMRFCFNPRDALSFSRIVSVPSRKIGNVTVDAVNSFARDSEADIMAILVDPGRVPGVPKTAVAPLQGFRAQIESVRATMGVLRPSELIDQVIEVMDLRRHYLDGTPQGEARMENLNELRGLAESFDDRDPAQGLEDFLAEVALVSDVDAYDENGEGVTLITLHMVKGLEFPVVFMVGLEEGLLPHQRALDEREENPSLVGAATEMAEERRLAYVGMTRAKDRLYLSCAFRRHLYGRSQPAFPSRFLTDIPQSLLGTPRGSAPVAPPRQGYKERYIERQVEASPAAPPVQRFATGDRG